MRFIEWQRELDLGKIPYRPGARHTQPFGLRTTNIGSPLHFGNDRGEGDRHIYMPLAGSYEWKLVDGVAGSLLQITPSNCPVKIEIQVFHTDADFPETIDESGQIRQGETLPFRAGELGLSAGIHTHTEVIIPFTLEDYYDLQAYCDELDMGEIAEHCERHKLNLHETLERIDTQYKTWRIREFWHLFGIREALPGYRVPHWGQGPTIHIDPRWALDI